MAAVETLQRWCIWLVAPGGRQNQSRIQEFDSEVIRRCKLLKTNAIPGMERHRPSFANWSQLDGWLRQMESLQFVA
jgi:hypothetical protein